MLTYYYANAKQLEVKNVLRDLLLQSS